MNELVRNVKRSKHSIYRHYWHKAASLHFVRRLPPTSGCRRSPAPPWSSFQELLQLYLVRMEHFPTANSAGNTESLTSSKLL